MYVNHSCENKTTVASRLALELCTVCYFMTSSSLSLKRDEDRDWTEPINKTMRRTEKDRFIFLSVKNDKTERCCNVHI